MADGCCQEVVVRKVWEGKPYWVWGVSRAFACRFKCRREGDKEVEEGAFGAILGDPAVGAAAQGRGCRRDDSAEAGPDVPGHERHEWEAGSIPYFCEEQVRREGERALDIEGGDVGVHVQRGVLEEDGLVEGPAFHGPPHAGGTWANRPHQLDYGGGA